MGLKANNTAGTPELADQETQLSYVEESCSGLLQLAMTSEEIEETLPVTLFKAPSSLSLSSSSCSDSDGDGVSECVVCLRKFHGGEQIRILPCGHVFHKGCVDKWLLDYKNMVCPSCRLCLHVNVNVNPAEQDGSSR